MLLGSVNLDFDRKVIVLAQDILHRVDVVLTHITETAGLVVPISAETLVYTVGMIRLHRSRSKPHVIVKLLRNRLRLKVFTSCPIELPGESRSSGDPDGERPTEKSAVHELLQRLDGGTKSIEGVLETEPSVETEYAAILVYRLNHLLTFTDSPCHRLLTEDVFPRLGSLNRHKSMPMGRSGDMDYIHIGIMNQVPPVMIRLKFCAEPLLTLLKSVVEVLLVNVADSDKAAALIADKMEVAHADATDTDDTAGHLVARRDKLAGGVSHLAEYLTGKYRQGADSQTSFLDKISSGLCHNQLCYCFSLFLSADPSPRSG